jgi:hypothetical protein
MTQVSPRVAILALLIVFVASFAGSCEPDCAASITGDTNTVTQACGGSGEESPASVTTPAPVVVPPTVITPVVVAPEGGGS